MNQPGPAAPEGAQEQTPTEVIQAIANVIDFDASLSVNYGGEGLFDKVDSIDFDSSTLIFIGTDGNPYQVRVRRVTEADCAVDRDGIVPPPITPKGDDSD